MELTRRTVLGWLGVAPVAGAVMALDSAPELHPEANTDAEPKREGVECIRDDDVVNVYVYAGEVYLPDATTINTLSVYADSTVVVGATDTSCPGSVQMAVFGDVL